MRVESWAWLDTRVIKVLSSPVLGAGGHVVTSPSPVIPALSAERLHPRDGQQEGEDDDIHVGLLTVG